MTFASIALAPPLVKAIAVQGFDDMTPVQEHTLPPLLAGKDVIAQARAGSGKTVAFGLALLSRLQPDVPEVQALVLCPTRELADQVSGELRRLARFIPNVRVVTLCGGVPVRTQRPALEQPPHILVGTPGRILDHLRRQTITLDTLRVLVLDEADRMLDMGFLDDIEEVVGQTAGARQTMLFSATYTDEVRAISRKLQRAPLEITVDDAAAIDVEQIFYEVEPERKLDLLTALLARQAEPALIFCHTRNDTRHLTEELGRRGFSALALHGELDQRDRDEVLLRFAHKSCSVLVATDVAARGLDIKGLPLVISWELPTDPDVHTHRIGRTGRAGEKGLAIALCAPRERARVAPIEARQQGPVRWAPLPSDQSLSPPPPAPAPMLTFLVEGGRQEKLRPGDLLGALTGDLGLPGDAVGKIDVGPSRAYVSIARARAEGVREALRATGGKIKVKGRSFRMSPLGGRKP
jgi:ATP-independent RNA helicase DbpA